jgi:hypothetical protein
MIVVFSCVDSSMMNLGMITKKDMFNWMDDRWSMMNRDSIASQIKVCLVNRMESSFC